VCAVFRRFLRSQHLKFTPERAAILDAVLVKTGFFEAEVLIEDLRQMGRSASRATIYRTLTHLQDAGILKQVVFSNRQSFYEVIAGRESSDYLVCVVSGKVVPFHSARLRELREAICREHGFDLISHEMHIFGISPEAKKKEQ
jgi:Fur family ferric uptake transcriptional regulator